MASILKVDKLDPQSGTALEIGTSGDTISVPSGATLDISASTLTPPATMPASSGVNLTALNATNLGSGTVPTARLGTGTASSSTILYGDNTWAAAAGGITAASQWRVHTSFTGSTNPITSNWEEVDTDGYGTLGSAMSESSGAWTFPSTGIWYIDWRGTFYIDGVSRYVTANMKSSTDGSNYDDCSWAASHISDEGSSVHTHATVGCSFIFDVTDTSTHLIQLGLGSENSSVVMWGNTGYNMIYATFIRLGDT